MIFNYDQKSIGLYKTEEESGLKFEKKEYLSSKIMKLCIIGVMLFFIFALIILFIKCVSKKTVRKIRKNELDDDFDYTIQNKEWKTFDIFLFGFIIKLLKTNQLLSNFHLKYYNLTYQ